MKKLILLLLLAGLLFAGYENKTLIVATANQYLYQSPCSKPKTFRLGSIDPRFHLTKAELLQDAEEAGSVWKNSQGMVLMRYDPNSDLPINMVYDQRQSLNSQINNLNNQVTQQKDTLQPEINAYEQKVTAFKQQSDNLNAQIQSWNNKGGAPQSVYNNLLAQQQSLQQQATQLQQLADSLNQSTDQYNTQTQQLNQKVDTFNNVLQYKPEEGIYIRTATSETINIYFNNSQQELIHTLAHEMGHALGLGHNDNPKSIMYPWTNLSITPSVDDEKALAVVCQKQSIFANAEGNITYIVGILKQEMQNSLSH